MTSSIKVAQRWLTAGETTLSVGDHFENEKWRVHRYADHVEITDLTNAGRRGKQVTQLRFSTEPGYLSTKYLPVESMIMEVLLNARRKVELPRMQQVMDEFSETIEGFRTTKSTYRGVDVAPSSVASPGGKSFTPIKLVGPYVSIEVKFSNFTVRDLVDKDNEPTAIDNSKMNVMKMYRWVRANEATLVNMKYHAVLEGMRKQGIKYHDYCAMD